jgi:tRNA/tmRNA/rRNA uracil-C5-methylase (TrmA/RlmC/RlmD family)
LAQHYAYRNAEENKVRNYTFFESDAQESLQSLQSQQILILDPPRSGIDAKLIQNIINTLPEHILYLSCNPHTQARDIAQLLPYYEYQWSRAYNLFPNTHHIEHLIHLRRKSGV